MSHFSVAVFHDEFISVEDLLAPFDESPEEACYLEWVKADESNEEIEANYQHNKHDNETLVQFAKRWYGYDWNPAYENFGMLDNPNARWDWWEVGGGWKDQLKLKGDEDKYCDEAFVGECDFSMDKEAYNKAARFWEVVVQGKPLKEGESEAEFETFYNKKYYKDRYRTKQIYAKHAASFMTYAYITPDGKWHETGKMGWFGMDNTDSYKVENYMKEFQCALRDYKKFKITIVDCHI